MRPILILAAVSLVAGGCATAPKQTVAGLNTFDPEYSTQRCRDARRAASQFDDNKEGRVVLALAGNLVVPFAGTAVAAAMGGLQEDDKKDLNKRVKAACISDPMAKKRQARR